MIQLRRTRRDRTDDTDTTEQPPPQTDQRAADASDAAACCVADIDDVLADMDDALPEESEEEQARRELTAIHDARDSGEIDDAEHRRRSEGWLKQYFHLVFGSCKC